MRRHIVAASVILAMLLCACGPKPSDQVGLPTPSPTTTVAAPLPSSSPAAQPQPLTGFSTADVSAPRTDQKAHLAAVRLARNDGFDRLVLEFTDRVPGYQIGYRALPILADPSAKEIPLPGASGAVGITLTSATGWDPDGRTYFGPPAVDADTTVVTQAKAAGDFEAVLIWVVGVRSEVPFRVSTLDGPPRLAVDFQH